MNGEGRKYREAFRIEGPKTGRYDGIQPGDVASAGKAAARLGDIREAYPFPLQAT